MSRIARLAGPFVLHVAFSAIFPAAISLAAQSAAPPPNPPAAEDDSDAPGTEGMRRRVGDKVAIMTSLNVAADEFVQGSVVCIGCHGRIDGRVLGDIIVVGGKLEIAGSGVGQLVSVGASVDLEPGARINGDLVNVGGKVHRDESQISGQVTDLGGPGVMAGVHGLTGLGGALSVVDTLFGIWFTLLTWVLLVVVLMLLAALVPDRIRRIAEEVPVIPVTAFLWGLFAYCMLAVACVLLFLSCIGIPLLPFVWFAFKIFKWLGMAGVFLFTGRRIGRWFHREIPLLGAILLGMAPFFLLRVLPFPCVGWISWVVLGMFGIGYVIATRAGRPPRVPGFAVAPIPSPPPAGPQPPPVVGLP